MKAKSIVYIGVLFVVTCLLFACSTKKSTIITRNYHALTTRYNTYFNAIESYREGVAQLEDNHKDRFDKILPPFIYSNEETAPSIFPQMDRTFEKCSKAITKHSILIKGIEHNRWIDDTYLLIGRSHFYKNDYIKALEAFDYVVRQFKDSPVRYQAMLWMARCYIEMENYERAQFMLDHVQENGTKKLASKHKLSLHKIREYKRVKRDLYAVFADLHIRQNSYQPAINSIEKSIPLASNKKQKRRYVYILGQLNQELNKMSFANHKYKWVLKMHPPYDMAFNAKMNMTECFNPNDPNEAKQVKKLFLKMSKDAKNKEYLDQIYYSLAQISFKENDSTKGIDYLKLSIENSKSNNVQKATSCLQLAEIYFDKKIYEPAQIYYDSTMIFLPKDYPDYEKIQSKHSVLSDLVKNLKIVYLEDSLQTIANMDENQRNKLINKVIQNVILEENKKKQEEALAQQQKMQALANNPTFGNQQSGEWYFYNTNMISAGYNEFLAKWGERKLEDNWRIKNKGLTSDFFEDAESDTVEKKTILSDVKNPETYINKLPLTEEKKEQSNQKIIEALYSLGSIYKEGLNENKKAIEAYEELLERFPDNKYQLNLYYMLYRLYEEEGNIRRSNHYKDLILSKYPDTDYAHIIKDPNYDISKNSVDGTVLGIYEQAYNNYQNRNYSGVISISENAVNKYPNTKYIDRFKYLLYASKFATHKDTALLISNLNVLINDAATSKDIKQLSNELLTLLSDKENITQYALPAEEVDNITNKIYFIDDKSIHLTLLVFNAMDINVENIKSSITDFNTKYFNLENLTINNIFLDDKRQLFTISNFNNKEKSIIYLNTLKQKWDNVKTIETDDYSLFTINTSNYKIFYNRKRYRRVFEIFSKKLSKIA